jgi:hypothetical protein
MDFKGKFFCSRYERGAVASCDEQCGDCVSRQSVTSDAFPSRTAEEMCADKPTPPVDNVVKMPEQPKGPVLVASISISMTDDGNLRVDGPFHDRILFHGLLEMARQYERDFAVSTARNAAFQAEQRKKEPFWKRKVREWNEGRAARMAADAATEAAKRQPK